MGAGAVELSQTDAAARALWVHGGPGEHAGTPGCCRCPGWVLPAHLCAGGLVLHLPSEGGQGYSGRLKSFYCRSLTGLGSFTDVMLGSIT